MRINDQIFQVGDINVRNMSSEQVAAVLRQSSMHGQLISFVVARPVHTNANDIDIVTGVASIPQAGISVETDTSTGEATGLNAELNQRCVLVQTSTIQDKNIDLRERITQELEKRASLSSTAFSKKKEPEDSEQPTTKLMVEPTFDAHLNKTKLPEAVGISSNESANTRKPASISSQRSPEKKIESQPLTIAKADNFSKAGESSDKTALEKSSSPSKG